MQQWSTAAAVAGGSVWKASRGGLAGKLRHGVHPGLQLLRAVVLLVPCPCRLDEAGYGVGRRLLEVLCYRERGMRRETRLLDMLKFVHSTLWRYMFGRQVW